MSSTDHLGRELDAGGEARTVTEFAVQQGTLDEDAPGVQEAIEADSKRAEQHTERAQALSDRLNEPAADAASVEDDQAEDDQAEDDQG